MSDPTLFDVEAPAPISAFTGKPVEAKARPSHPPTSHEAAESVNCTKGQIEAITTLAKIGPSTADQIKWEIRRTVNPNVSDSGPRSRLAQLKQAGLVRVLYHTDERQAVYGLTDAGRTYLAVEFAGKEAA